MIKQEVIWHSIKDEGLPRNRNSSYWFLFRNPSCKIHQIYEVTCDDSCKIWRFASPHLHMKKIDFDCADFTPIMWTDSFEPNAIDTFIKENYD